MNNLTKNKACDQLYLSYLNKVVEVKIDRPLNSLHPKHGFKYNVNYGFVPKTKASDGEEIDAYVLGINKPLKNYKGKCIAIIHRLNDLDDKLVVVPENSNIDNFTDKKIQEQTYFQEQYFESVIIR
ncbi:inorganic pyrophosphatase [bacterium]|nr:inorganic pyrophosphatase [bacterium]|tara:strand:+ start:116 stop:493 length:378 start_codon:yes stop_codon:yes gene_type:complete